MSCAIVLTELADQFDAQAEKCIEMVGAADCALTAAAIWESAAKRVRKAAEVARLEQAGRSEP
jgi:hypothetical protein